MMNRLLIALLGTLLVALPCFASDWSVVAKDLKESIVFIQTAEGSCTGFVIDNDRYFMLTAEHCDGKEMYVDLSPAKVRAKHVKNDLMVVEVEGIDRQALKFAAKNPKVGDEVA